MSVTRKRASLVRTTHEEREAMERLNDHLESYIRKTTQLHSSHSSLVSSMRASRRTSVVTPSAPPSPTPANMDRLRSRLKQQDAENVRLQDTVRKLSSDLSGVMGVKDDLDLELTKCHSTCEALRTDLRRTEETYQGKVASLESKISTLSAELQDMQSQANVANQRAVEAEADATTLRHQLNHQESLHATKVMTLEQDLRVEMKRTRSRTQPTDEAMEAMLAEAKQQFLQASRGYHKQLRTYYHEQQQQTLSGVNAQWFNEERERLLQQVVELTSTNADLSASNKSLHARVGVVEQEATSLRQSLQEEAQRHLSELKTKEERIAVLSASIEDNRKKYADLLEQRLWLDAEIDEYRRLLESLDRRPRRTHVLAGNTSAQRAPAAPPPSPPKTPAEPALTLEGVDPNTECLLVVNPSTTTAIDMDDWALTATTPDASHISTLEFSSHVLGPGEKLRVFHKRNEHFVENQDCLWEELSDLDLSVAHELRLFDPKDRLAGQIFLPPLETHQFPVVLGGDECCVM